MSSAAASAPPERRRLARPDRRPVPLELRSVGGRLAFAQPWPDGWSSDRLVTTDGNRWSRPGERAIYLASDVGVAIAEAARHLAPGDSRIELGVWSIEVHRDALLDVREPGAVEQLVRLKEGPWVLDRETCREIAAKARAAGAEGLIVPSVAFLDQPDRWNLVLFPDGPSPSFAQGVRDPRLELRFAPV